MTKKRVTWIVLLCWPVIMFVLKLILNLFQSPTLSEKSMIVLNFSSRIIGTLMLLSPIPMIIGIVLIVKWKKKN